MSIGALCSTCGEWHPAHEDPCPKILEQMIQAYKFSTGMQTLTMLMSMVESELIAQECLVEDIEYNGGRAPYNDIEHWRLWAIGFVVRRITE